MSEPLIRFLTTVIVVAGYFFLLDYVRPALAERHLLALWWVIVGVYVTFVFGYGNRAGFKANPGLFGAGYLLFAAAVYLYDPSLQPFLTRLRIEWLWIVALVGFFIWIIVFVRIARRDAQQKSG